MKDKIRPIYSELQGYLKEAPPVGDSGHNYSTDEFMWNQFNSTVEELSLASDFDFSKFKVTGIIFGGDANEIMISEYRSKLGGLIARLHGTYFSDETAPFSGMPSTTIHLSNQQEQHQSQNIVIEFEKLIDEKINNFPEDSNERNFLTRLKSGLGGVKDFSSIMLHISEIGKAYNIGMDDLMKIFSA